MTVLDLCAGRRVLSAIIGLSLLAPLSPDMVHVRVSTGWRYAVVAVACLILVYAFACLMVGRCNIAGLAVAATAYWVTLAMWNLLAGLAGPALLQLTIAGLVGFLHVTHDLSGRRERAHARPAAPKVAGGGGVVTLDREHR